MTTERKITVAQALQEMKTTEKRINEVLAEAPFVAVKKPGATHVARGVSFDKWAADVTGRLQKIQKLQENYAALKAAVVLSNANTMVKIGKETMTVAAAIERRKTSLALAKTFRDTLIAQLTQAQRTLEQDNDAARKNAQKLGENLGKDGSLNADEVQKVIDSNIAKNSSVLVDPGQLNNIVAAQTERIDEFEQNVDIALTASNVTTMITVNF